IAKVAVVQRPAPAPQPVAPPRQPAVPTQTQRPPTAPIQTVQPARPPTGPVQTVRVPTAPIPTAAGSSAPATPAAVPKLLKETEVYIKYGLHEKALEHLRKIFSADPDNIEAHDKAKAVALATGRNEDAIASLATVLRLSIEHGDPRAEEARKELEQLDPANPALAIGGGNQPDPLPIEEEIAVEDEAAVEVEPVSAAAGRRQEEEEEEETIVDESIDVEAPAPASAAADDDEFASDIAEADFYIQAGLPEDARALLEGILLAVPHHQAAMQRLQELGG